jgi:pentatricopeptide repeat domain-containing protein 1
VNTLFSVLRQIETMLSRLRRYGGAAAAAADSDVVPFSAIKNDITAYLWFDIILSRGTGSISDYNTLLSFLLKQGAHTTVISLAQKLESRSDQIQVFPDIDTRKILITCYSRKGYMASAFSLFDKIIKTGHHPSTPILNDLFEGLSLQGEIHKALLVYNDFLLKGFKLDYVSYDILIEGLCKIGETEKAIELLRQVKIVGGYSNFYVRSFYNNIIFRLCKDRLVNQAYDLYSEMIVKKIMPGAITYHNLIYGYCIVGQFKQAIALFRKLEAYMDPSVYVPTLVTEGEVKAAKSTIALMIKGGVKPIVASFHSVIDELYKGEGRVDKIAQMVETLRRFKPKLEQYYSD